MQFLVTLGPNRAQIRILRTFLPLSYCYRIFGHHQPKIHQCAAVTQPKQVLIWRGINSPTKETTIKLHLNFIVHFPSASLKLCGSKFLQNFKNSFWTNTWAGTKRIIQVFKNKETVFPSLDIQLWVYSNAFCLLLKL